MVNVIIWGAGIYCKHVVSAIKSDKCNLIGIVDSRIHASEVEVFEGIVPLYPVNKVLEEDIDYIVIAIENSKSILEQCSAMNIENNKIIDYWHVDEEYEFIDASIKKIFLLEKELEECKCKIRNMPYELGVKPLPIIKSAKECLEIILRERKSLSRFGDGELEIMQNRARPWFQDVNPQLARRLEEVFSSQNDNIIIALADNFGSLEKYTEYAAQRIRQYLDKGIREELMKSIDMSRVYYDTYVTRPYLIYKDKNYAKSIFEQFMKIWSGREVLFVEGKTACIGVRNDLFKGAKDVKRILAPSTNAFDSYKDIMTAVKKNVNEDTLVLVSLGPTATVLTYDLAKEGIQALDIGQLDTEYEWYLRGATDREAIPGKTVAELKHARVVDKIEDEEYSRQIVAVIG